MVQSNAHSSITLEMSVLVPEPVPALWGELPPAPGFLSPALCPAPPPGPGVVSGLGPEPCARSSWLHLLLLQAFTQRMASACWVPGTVLGAGNVAVNQAWVLFLVH